MTTLFGEIGILEIIYKIHYQSVVLQNACTIALTCVSAKFQSFSAGSALIIRVQERRKIRSTH